MKLRDILLGAVFVGAGIAITGLIIKNKPMEYGGLALAAVVGAGKEAPPIRRWLEEQEQFNAYRRGIKRYYKSD